MLWMAGELQTHCDALDDDAHCAWYVAKSAERVRADMYPEGYWSVPFCMSLMAANLASSGQSATPNDAMSILRDARRLKPGAGECLVRFGESLTTLIDDVVERKQAKAGAWFQKYKQRQDDDTRRSVPERYE